MTYQERIKEEERVSRRAKAIGLVDKRQLVKILPWIKHIKISMGYTYAWYNRAVGILNGVNMTKIFKHMGIKNRFLSAMQVYIWIIDNEKEIKKFVDSQTIPTKVYMVIEIQYEDVDLMYDGTVIEEGNMTYKEVLDVFAKEEDAEKYMKEYVDEYPQHKYEIQAMTVKGGE